VEGAARVLAERLAQRLATAKRRDVVVETIDGERAAGSPHADALRAAGFRSLGGELRYYPAVR
jgi:hypothetical protein